MTSAVPPALSALHTLATAAASFEGVFVCDGPPGDQVPVGTKEYFVVGSDWDPAGGGTAQPASTLEPYSDWASREALSLPCAIVVWSGANLAAQRTRAGVILAALRDLLVANPTLGGAVGYAADASLGGPAVEGSLARIASTAWRQVTSGGAGCAVTVTVTAGALVEA